MNLGKVARNRISHDTTRQLRITYVENRLLISSGVRAQYVKMCGTVASAGSEGVKSAVVNARKSPTGIFKVCFRQ